MAVSGDSHSMILWPWALLGKWRMPKHLRRISHRAGEASLVSSSNYLQSRKLARSLACMVTICWNSFFWRSGWSDLHLDARYLLPRHSAGEVEVWLLHSQGSHCPTATRVCVPAARLSGTKLLSFLPRLWQPVIILSLRINGTKQ